MGRIVIIGGHGRVGLRLATVLSDGGDAVTSIIRNPDHRDDVAATGATPVVADVEHLTTEEIAERLTGHDAVVWSAGAGGGDPARTRAVDQDAAIRSMDAARAAGVERYVMVSYLGARVDHGVPPDNGFFAYAEAKAAADAHLKGTDLAWTIVGPGRLTTEPGSGRIEIGDAPASDHVSRDDVAQVIAGVLARDQTVGRFLGFNEGDTPIDEALDALA